MPMPMPISLESSASTTSADVVNDVNAIKTPLVSTTASTTTTISTTITTNYAANSITNTTVSSKTDDAVLDSNADKKPISKEEENIRRSSKLEKYRIIYNKKAESEFFVDNSALAGFTGERILYMAIRELIENSLDSCESFSILPSIKVSLKTFDPSNDMWVLSCEDNGTGINSEKLPVAVCSFLTSAKYMEKQQRGLFGVGLKMVAAFSTKDTDFPIRVWNRSIDESDEYYFELRTDIGTNKPIVLSKRLLKGNDVHIKSRSGFKIEVILRAKLMPITKNKIYEYVSETSIVNPYASITFETDDGIFNFDRRTTIMPQPAQEILPHPSDMDLKTLKKAISKFHAQKISLPKILSLSFQKLSYEKAKDIVTKAGLSIKTGVGDFTEHDLIKIVNVCKKTRFQNPNTDHLSPIGENVLTIGMMSEYTIVSGKSNDALTLSENLGTRKSVDQLEPGNSVASLSSTSTSTVSTTTDATTATATGKTQVALASLLPSSANDDTTTLSNEDKLKSLSPNSDKLVSSSSTKGNTTTSKSNFSVKVLKPVLTAYTSRTCVINNRPTIVETGLAYGGDIPSFKMYRFANKIPLLYDEGSDVAREVISEVEINKMGITKKQAKEQFSATNTKESKKDRIIEVLPLHIFFHICSTKIPYKTAGKESIASEGELKYYMKSCLSELYRKLSTQIRKELKLKEAENKLRLYKHYLPFIVDSINESLGVKSSKLSESFTRLIENHLSKKPLTDESEGKSSSVSFASNNPLSLAPSSSPSPFGSQSFSYPNNKPSSTPISSTSRSSTPKFDKSKSNTSDMKSLSLPEIDHKYGKKNQLLRSNKHKKENSISTIRQSGSINNNNNSNTTIKKISRSSDQFDNKTKQSRSIAENRKLNKKATKVETISKERKSKLKKSSTSNKNDENRTNNILKKDILRIKNKKPSRKMNINRGTFVAKNGSDSGPGNASKISSSTYTSQSKQFQSTMDSFNKRVNKGKRK
ncbi:Type 2 DNA topoisomerase 6 subunit B [Candidatus Nitrosocosmicus franklandus]|uniref:Type 2 DNA topoisomerase 6 subunit B n=2 Tax=Candidatus Nitrosocosmicus franklandianus TaxID=1798806 RepID=A0A484IDE8_9ARCH|nr:Type 2 DNA topoisomerase 6 subunit B [Candidatus Nitrosocosmicus franklandus]